MLKIPKKHLSLTMVMLGTLLASFSTIVNANTIVRQVIAAGGGQMTAGGNTLSYTIGQPIISTDYSAQLLSGFWAGIKMQPPSVELVTVVSTSPVCLDKPFDVIFQVLAADEQSVDGIQVYLEFDPSQLRVNDVASLGALDFTLLNDFSNTDGYVNFAASSFFQAPPTGNFNLIRVNFTALQETAGTLLHINPDKTASKFGGEDLLQVTNDTTLVISECIKCKVNLQGRAAKPNNSWITDLDIHTDEIQSITTDNKGYCILPTTVSLGNQSFCVKNSHTLANKVGPPVALGKDKRVALGTLLEGDINNDNQINLDDAMLISPLASTTYNKCLGDDGYNANADLNADTCVNAADIVVGFGNGGGNKGNFGKLSACSWDENTQTLRKRQRDSKGTVGLRTTPIPAGLAIGSSFEVAIEVQAETQQSVDGTAVYLNFDPDKLQVNQLTPGEQFDFVLQNDFDNTQGYIDFAATTFWAAEFPTGKFTLVTIHFTLLAQDGAQTLSFSQDGHRKTAAVSGGESVLAPPEQGGGEVIIENPMETYSAFSTIHDQLGNPLAGVTIEINGKTTVTDANGFWEIKELMEGDYTVIASKDGYLFPIKSFSVGNDQNAKVTLKPKSMLEMKVIVQPNPVHQGDNVTYTVTVTNRGSQTATDVILTETLPKGTTLLTLTISNGGDCDTDTMTCSLPKLVAGASATMIIVVGNTQASRLENTITVTANEYPSDVVTKWTTVIPYLSVSITDTPDPISIPSELHYAVTASLSKYAPSPATGIELVFTLPNSVELQSVSAADGMCDTSKWPQITCLLIDLNVDSQVTVYFEVELQDAGLLLLTSEAQVSANEYPTHTARERTKIQLPEVEVDIAFVIDVTGSMQGEIDDVIEALKLAIDEIKLLQKVPLVALVVFTDEVKVKAVTQDLDVLVNAVKKLQANGGGTCPEAAVEALQIAIPHTKAEGYILFATDASPYDDADIEGIIELLRNKGIRFNAIITGDCTQQESWNELPNDD